MDRILLLLLLLRGVGIEIRIHLLANHLDHPVHSDQEMERGKALAIDPFPIQEEVDGPEVAPPSLEAAHLQLVADEIFLLIHHPHLVARRALAGCHRRDDGPHAMDLCLVCVCVASPYLLVTRARVH